MPASYSYVMVTYLCFHRAVRGVVGDGDAYCPEVVWLCRICSAFCSFCLLCGVDCVHSTGYGGTFSFPPRAPSALVRMTGMKMQ